ncbi:MAG TPA: DUF4912 domain-containing protein [Firmicutes bacterium]|nr:DUF4912 domain-containing protein [Bacillota bacterium]
MTGRLDRDLKNQEKQEKEQEREVEEISLPAEVAELATIETREINLAQDARRGEIYPRFMTETEYELPAGYGETKLVLQVRDPYWMHAYWEISEETIRDIQRMLGPLNWNEAQRALRVHDITGIDFNGANAHYSFDIPINNVANNWYINVERPNRRYCVDLGVKNEAGDFILITRSNPVHTPRDGISEIVDEEWMTLEAIEKLYPAPSPRGPSSPEFMRSQEIQGRLEYEEVGSGAVGVISSPGPGVAYPRKKGFWLTADVEIIIYGATERDAAVTIQGMPVKLRPDGTFTVRFALPDGEQVIPVEAVSAGGEDRRRITMTITRKTT